LKIQHEEVPVAASNGKIDKALVKDAVVRLERALFDIGLETELPDEVILALAQVYSSDALVLSLVRRGHNELGYKG
jgi:hypothetical protein